jgi:1-aminocyclopropane-1-carboxylate synthase
MTISKRAKKLQSESSPIMVGHSICAENPYSFENPKGYLNFGTAENHLMNDLLVPKINEKIELKKEHIQYNTLYGMENVRKTIANFLQTYLNITSVDPDNIVIQTGVSAICESLSFAMFDKDDIILIPAPYYTGFDHDFTKRFACNFERIQLSHEDGFTHQIEHFKNQYEKCEDKSRVKAILLTHPHNPTGEVLSEDFMMDMINFCKTNELELISDEIYALSSHQSEQHISLYQLARKSGVKAHLLYGMAKDFALAGLKVGFYYSEDQELVRTIQNLSYFHPVSTQTQLLVESVLGDNDFLEKYIPMNKKRLQQIPVLIEAQLPMFDFIPTDAGLFFMLDLSKYCKSFDNEFEYFEKFLNYIRINLTPGKELGLTTPGFYRVCFARPKEDILEFIVRMRKFHENELTDE